MKDEFFRELLERHNGCVRTWWHYNRATLALLLLVIMGMCWWLHAERYQRQEAEAETRQVAKIAWPMLGCWTQKRNTSVLVVGSNQQAVYDAVYAAEQQLLSIRGAYLIAMDPSHGRN